MASALPSSPLGVSTSQTPKRITAARMSRPLENCTSFVRRRGMVSIVGEIIPLSKNPFSLFDRQVLRLAGRSISHHFYPGSIYEITIDRLQICKLRIIIHKSFSQETTGRVNEANTFDNPYCAR